MVTAMILLFAILIIYLLMLQGRVGRPELSELKKYKYAHRGLFGGNVPENSMEAFRLAFDHGYGVELDLHLLKDGSIGIMHDSSMKRMTGQDRILEDLTLEELNQYHLNGTEQTIPEFSQVLQLCSGRYPLIIELKSYKGNGDKVAETACRMLEGYEGAYCLESFDPKCVYWLKKHRPELIRGQLSENFLKIHNSGIPWILRFLATYHLESFVTRPDFIAHKYSDRKTLSNFLIRRLWRVQGVSWTLTTPQEYEQAVKEGWIPIFEGFHP